MEQSEADELMTEYIAVYEDTGIPAEKAEAMRAVIAHLSVEIRRNVEKVIVQKGKPIQVIPRSAN